MTARPRRPSAWAALERALTERRPVRARYHGGERLLWPHVLGWKNDRPEVLAYQAGGTTSHAEPPDPRQRWRCMFVDEIEDAVLADGPWQTADNYSPSSNCIEAVEIAL